MIILKRFLIIIIVILDLLATRIAASPFDDVDGEDINSEQFEFDCFPPHEKENLLPRFASRNQNDSIAIQVSKRVTHQLTSRIFSIFLREILGYKNVKLVEIKERPSTIDKEKLFVTLENLVSDGINWPEPTIDLEVWMLSDYHVIPPEIEEAGAITTPGRFGIFIPKSLVKKEDLFPKLYPYTMFQDEPDNSKSYEMIKKFDISENVLESLIRYSEKRCGDQCDENGLYVPEQCKDDKKCAIVLAPYYQDTSFIINHIQELQFKMKVMWTGRNFKVAIQHLMNLYSTDRYKVGKKFLVLSWTPSEIIGNRWMEFIPLTMPKCEDIVSSNVTGCKYELTPLLKYYSQEFKNADYALQSLIKLYFNKKHIQSMISLYDKYEVEILRAGDDSNLGYEENGVSKYYNMIACEWMHGNKEVYKNWKPKGETKEDIYIGGIFPLSAFGTSYKGITPAAMMAEMAINRNDSILPNHKLIVLKNDGQCRADTVMKTFINYYLRQERMIGVLGPACSETVEPIAGVSKHFRMAVISYSAEGAFLSDRETYPYFFRTIGENRQYEHVYTRLLKKLNWHRVAALTEDGQKSTEYISHMETLLKENQIELISNKKFPRERSEAEMNRFLLDLKTKKAKIIIADIDDSVAQMIMCEAFKLGMTAENGYIWFLPVWLSNIWKFSEYNSQHNVSSANKCTNFEMMKAINGHFSLSHAPFADDSTRFDVEEKTVGQWKQEYLKTINEIKVPASDYAGYAYDAVWVYALALNQLIQEDPSYLSDLHSIKTTKRLMEVIKATDFLGVSGRIRFGEAGSRYTIVNVLQWINGTPNIVGKFRPNISEPEHHLVGGHLYLNESAIVWMTKDGKPPDDGAFVCSMAAFARFLSTDCDGVYVVVMTFAGLNAIIILSAASFMFWKRKYDQKIKASAKYMRNFGIDLLSPSAIPVNTLDKWEIPKDRVVINRRLGEGAFGTVYGGEAQIDGLDAGWTAVAVKTLKAGSTTDDKVDFLSEAESMKRFDHKNVVSLLGVCLQTEPVYTIMEFMLYGDLKTYLLARRHLVNSKQTDDTDISPKRLTMMALDISRALSYLAEQKYVHRDVACRNCMVNAQRVVKLGDFGMARPTFENDYYRFNRKGMLPVRWMSPESLGLGIFTPASDVWSYGVLLYEIITFGSFPFQGMTNNQVLDHIKMGNTLTIPVGVKPQLEGLLKACWNQDYKKRPNASEICEFISNFPRLLSPCLDVPLASVQMAETDSDQFELLPGLRKRQQLQQQLLEEEMRNNMLTKSATINNLDSGASNYNNMTANKGVSLNNFNVATDTIPNCESMANNLSLNVYNPIEPLLRHDEEISKSNNSLLRYVPMFGFGKNKTPMSITTPQNGAVSVGIKSTSTSVL